MYGVPPPSSVPNTAATPVTRQRSSSTTSRHRFTSTANYFDKLSWRDPVESAQRILTEHDFYWLVAGALLIWEIALTSAIILKVPYTEIDFKTYLQQANVFLSGERDYSLIKGDSGPCVYPAGHLYIYSLLHYLTDSGRHLERGQWLFGGIYIATLALVFSLYSHGKRIPPYALIFLTVSKRIHSLYVLRLFNDCIAMFFLYAALRLYTRRDQSRSSRTGRWIVGTCLFSLALSIKMSILLFLPALLYLLFVYHSPLALLRHTVLLLTTQILLASPFLQTRSLAEAYFAGAFDFNREFLWEWTVNWRWIGVEVFEDPAWGKVLLMLHAAGLGALAIRWSEEEGGAIGILKRAWKRPSASPARGALTNTRVVTLFFLSNLLGILCARSLHYQFYVWFYHSLVWLVWEAWDGLGIEAMQKLVFISLIEYGFFTFPSTVNSSLGLVLSLLIIVVVSWYGRPAGDQGEIREESTLKKDE
ncbi:dolichyl-P-Man:Man(5)GlcNAc(2)-PP-dolichol alpha-1,3-mannosyltransferase [Sporobolomyces salmoneus]|uniref:dolichyl-P-Man:Man(5)GlcNAc(2)-PP-dolichol alpha-1,3-mannosyltransferase n=1 Tax=Sporobolomyces salmoneus TaxID=183962 RepID=UPI0031734C69